MIEHDIDSKDPYEVLGLHKMDRNTVEVKQIKTAYRKLALLYHPDKFSGKDETEVKEAQEKFQKISFANWFLMDDDRRKTYNETGIMEGVSDDETSWQEYFRNMSRVSFDMIEKDKVEYQGSEEEIKDVIESFDANEGDFLEIFNEIPHLEFNEEEEDRMFKIIQNEIEKGTIEAYQLWKEYKKNRKKKIKEKLKEVNSEAQEAEEYAKELGIDLNRKKSQTKQEGEEELRQLMLQRKKGSFDDMISRLESKYVNNKVKKSKGKTKKSKK